MKKLINFLARERLLVFMFVLLVIVLGDMALKNLNREAFPNVNFDMVSVETIYPGGSPEEIEQFITVPIEKKIREVDNIDKVRSYNVENVSVVVVYIDDRTDNKQKVVQDIKDAVDLVENLPENADRPLVKEIKIENSPIIDIAVSGVSEEVPYLEIRKAADELENMLLDIDGVAEVEMKGFFDKEYLVEANPSALKRYRIGLNTVINDLKRRNLDLPGGPLRIGDKEYVLRTKGQYKNIQEIKDTVIMSNDAGYVTRLKDIASVTETTEEPDVLNRFNGKPAVMMTVWKKRAYDELKLTDHVKEKLADFKFTSTDRAGISTFNETSRYTRNSLNSVITNAVTGFILLAAVLFLLLGFRMSLIVTLSIPVAFMFAFFMMKTLGITINVISLFGMVMVLGMIVDFSIVVSENGFRYLNMGMGRLEAISKGTEEVVWPITTTMLCIFTAFAPLLILGGIFGKFIKDLPATLLLCLFASWLGALFVIPSFMNTFARASRKNIHTVASDNNPESFFERGRFGNIQRKYFNLLNLMLKWRYAALIIMTAALIGSLGLLGKIGFTFSPRGGEEFFAVYTKMPQTTNLKANMREAVKIENILLQMDESELDALHSAIGEKSSDLLDPKPGEGTHKSSFNVYLTAAKGRDREALDIFNETRDRILDAQAKGIISKDMGIEFSLPENGPPVGKPVNIEIRGEDFKTINRIAGLYTEYLSSIEGVRDITTDYEAGKEEYRYRINGAVAKRTGVSTYDVATTLNASYEGVIATNVKIEEDDIGVRVRFPEWARKNRSSLESVMVENNTGGLIPLTLITSVDKQTGISQINRLDYKRLVQVQADVDTTKVTSVTVNSMLMEKFRDIEKEFPGYHISYGGEHEETGERMVELGQYFLIALFIIFMILTAYFKSIFIPLVVMIAIPYSLIGLTLAILAHGQMLHFMSYLGFFSLAGVIVSNTLVLVEFINNLRSTGLPIKEALSYGGVIRLRPILLTTGTTVLGLIPSIYGFGGKDHMVAPLALSFGYGLIFATIITLILIPSFYHIAEDIKCLIARILNWLGIEMDGSLFKAECSNNSTE